MRIPRLLIALIVALAMASPTVAASVPRLQGTITDQVGALSGHEAQVKTALDALLRDHDIELFVLFVATTDPMTVTEFADETARVNSLGANDALLLVAMTDRTDAIWVSNALASAVTDPELNQIVADSLEPALRGGDAAAAVVATAEALGAAAEPAPVVTAPPATAPPIDGGGPVGPVDGGGSGGGVGALGVVGLLLLVAGVAVVGWWLMTRLTARREAEERDRETGRLARDANAALIAIDERIRSADQEAGFVEAQFDEAAAAPFRAAIAEAREELKAAFGVRQRLDDATPEDPPTRMAMLKEITDRCGRAGAALDRQAARIKELRDLEQHADSILAALPAQIDALDARLPGADSALGQLGGFAESAWSAVKGNVAEARKGLAGARRALERARAALARSDRRVAAREIATAQEGIAGATALLDAVDKLAAAIRDAHDRLPAELTAAEADLETARAAHAEAATSAGAVAATLTAAEAAVKAATDAATAQPLDPPAAYRLAAAARRAAGEALAAVRQDAAQRAQLTAALATTLAAAKASVDRAADFIATRRSGVGRRARTRLAEAQASLDAALRLRDTDPHGSMDRARRADDLADEAYSLAQQDFAGWDQNRANPSGGPDVGALILGGIIGGILAGGGRHGGWGGSPWGGPSGGGGGGWGGGHSVGGGFGGFGGGGGGGGGGGHSVGGHW